MARADANENLDRAVSMDSTILRTGVRKNGQWRSSRVTTPSAGHAAD
jgi:hypothetical protein